MAGDTVHLCAGTYALSATVTVAVDLTIAGDGASTTIVDGGSSVGLFVSSGSLTVSDLTLQNGTRFNGGAIAAFIAKVTNSTFTANNATNDGGAVAAVSVTVTNSTFTANNATVDGGAIIANVASVTNSTFSANSAANGGGAIDAFIASAANSTFSANSAGVGGAINATSATAANSTFSANSAGVGGGAIAFNNAIVTNSTFSANSAGFGGVIEGNTASVTNTLFAEPTATNNCFATTGITDGGGNFSTDASCAFTQPTSHVVSPAQLALGSLASNGGTSQTIALGAASVARDAGIDAVCAAAPVNGLDQRGISRPQGAHCDSGAYEYVAPAPPPAPAPTPVPLSLTKGVATSQAGPFASTLTAPLGSTVWYALSLTNTGSSPLTGVTLVDSAAAGALPAGCPPVPASLAAAAVYACTYAASVTRGTTINTATASVGGGSVTATATVTARPPVLTDSIGPGVNRGSSGFGTASVVLPTRGYVTYLVRLDSSLVGQAVEIWTRTKSGAWVKTTSRLVAADGTVHYYRKISTWTGFWAKLADGASHGRIGTVR